MSKPIPAQPGDLAVELLPWGDSSADVGAEVKVLFQCDCYVEAWYVEALCPLASGIVGKLFDYLSVVESISCGERCCLPKKVLFKKLDDVDPPTTAKDASPRSKEFSR